MTTGIIQTADTGITNIANIIMAVGRDRGQGLDLQLHLDDGTVAMTEIGAVSDNNTRIVIRKSIQLVTRSDSVMASLCIYDLMLHVRRESTVHRAPRQQADRPSP